MYIAASNILSLWANQHLSAVRGEVNGVTSVSRSTSYDREKSFVQRRCSSNSVLFLSEPPSKWYSNGLLFDLYRCLTLFCETCATVSLMNACYRKIRMRFKGMCNHTGHSTIKTLVVRWMDRKFRSQVASLTGKSICRLALSMIFSLDNWTW